MSLPALHPDSLLRKALGPVETTVGSEVVLMELGAGACYGLGETGSDVWRQLAQPIRLATLIENLRAEYQAPPGVLEQDVAELLEDLRRRNLILIDQEAAAPEPPAGRAQPASAQTPKAP